MTIDIPPPDLACAAFARARLLPPAERRGRRPGPRARAAARASLAALALLVALASARAATPDEQVVALLDEAYESALRASPVWASSLGDHRWDDAWPDVGPEARARRREEARARLARAKAIDRTALSPGRRLDLELLVDDLELSIAGQRFESWQMPVTQVGGPHQSIPHLAESLRLDTPELRRAYVRRLEGLPAYVEQVIANLRAGLAAKRTPSRAVLGDVPAQLRAHTGAAFDDEPETHVLFGPFRDAAEDDPLAAEARRAILTRALPALRALAAFLEKEYLPGCRESIAAADLPDGAAAYAHVLRAHTTVPDLDADRIHAIGLAEVARIRREMEEVIDRTDFAARDGATGEARFAAFVAHLRTDARFYHTTAEGLVAGYRDIAKRIDAELPRLFGRLPRLPYGVKEMDAAIAPSNTTARYHPGSPELGRPGWFVANTYRLDQRPKYEMIPLTLHEAVPGHHLQIALAQELEGMHRWRRLAHHTAFVEGWALYAERLGLDMGGGERGLYADPYDDFGRLSYEMWRALRLVVDTGIHAKGWTRERAVDLMLANSALTELNVRREVDRYVAWPGQATAYKIGEIEIRRVRAQAEARLGDRFDLRAFHDALLANGPLPLGVLRAEMDRWIAAAADD